MGYSKGELFLGSEQPDYSPDAADRRIMRPRYDRYSEGFSFLAVDTNELFFRQGAADGGWSVGIPFYAEFGGTIAYNATINLDMAALSGSCRTITLTGPLTLTTSNRARSRQLAIRLLCDGTSRALTFPADWVFMGTKPSTLAANKAAVLSLVYFGVADADCVAAYGVQA